MTKRYMPVFADPRGVLGSLATLKEEGKPTSFDPVRKMTKADWAAWRKRMREPDEDDIVLKSGRYIRANCGYVGINQDLKLSEGYDGHVDGTWSPKTGTYRDLTRAERQELADLMIARWWRYKAQG